MMIERSSLMFRDGTVCFFVDTGVVCYSYEAFLYKTSQCLLNLDEIGH
jgi:hypothetical protein